ncbi:MAG: type VI secretion system tube protein TssD [Bacteroidales bacterium]|jgi:hypothetical protein
MEEIKLDIENLKDVKVYNVSYGASLPMSGLEANAAAARLMLSEISLSIELTDKTEFIQWITTKKKLSGTIKVEDANNPGSNLRTIKFSDAYICSFNESFSGGGGGNSAHISIACTAIDINGIKYDVRKGK